MGIFSDILDSLFSNKTPDVDPDSLGFDNMMEGVPEDELEEWNNKALPKSAKTKKLSISDSPVITEYLTTRNFTNSNRANSSIKYIVIHYTAGKGDTAKANCSYFYSTYRGASSHYFVDEDHTYQCVSDNDIAWHCGTTGTYYSTCRNSSSIGIEMCSDYKNGAYYISNETVTRVTTLVKYLMGKYSIDSDHVIRHYDVTHKNCPAPWVSNNSLWTGFKSKLTNTTTTTGGDYVGRNSAHIVSSDTMHIMKIPISDFRVQYLDKPKKSAGVSNYFNCGYFAKFSSNGHPFTLPVANLKCDIYTENVDVLALPYFKGNCEYGEIDGTKLICETSKVKTVQFANKKVSTLFVYQNGMAQIEATNFVPSDANYAVSGAPVMLKGIDVSWKNVTAKQGWDTSITRATWHGFIGLKNDGYIYYISMKTTSSNLFTTSEAYNKLKPLGFIDVIKVDGGGSFIFNLDGKIVYADSENRRINNIGRCL